MLTLPQTERLRSCVTPLCSWAKQKKCLLWNEHEIRNVAVFEYHVICKQRKPLNKACLFTMHDNTQVDHPSFLQVTLSTKTLPSFPAVAT